MIRRGPIDTGPERISGAGPGRANIGVAIVTVDTPGVKNSLVIQKLMAWAADVIHDLVPAILLERLSNSSRDVIQHLVPAFPLPFSRDVLKDNGFFRDPLFDLALPGL